MLTADLLRAQCRQGRIYPRYIDPQDPQLLGTAGTIIEVYKQALSASPAWSKERLDEELDDRILILKEPLIYRGLRKLAYDRSLFEMDASVSPLTLRNELFQRVASISMRRAPGVRWREQRRTVIADLAEEMEIKAAQLEALLFADLEVNHRLKSFRELSPGELLNRYNLALAQAVLLRASRMEVVLGKAPAGTYRQIFRSLKFNQLIHRIQKQDAGEINIHIDGPLSLFSSINRYGLAMARFLPTLVMCSNWRLEAEVLWGKERKSVQFFLDQKRGLISTVKARGQYITDEQRWFEERFEKLDTDWTMNRSSELLQTEKGEVIVPDLVFINRKTAKKAYLEIIGFWRQGSLQGRLVQLERPALSNLILAVSHRLRGDREENSVEHDHIHWFKQIINVKEVCAMLDGV